MAYQYKLIYYHQLTTSYLNIFVLIILIYTKQYNHQASHYNLSSPLGQNVFLKTFFQTPTLYILSSMWETMYNTRQNYSFVYCNPYILDTVWNDKRF